MAPKDVPAPFEVGGPGSSKPPPLVQRVPSISFHRHCGGCVFRTLLEGLR